jgi:iron complex transport system ATP-binding protein
MIELDHITVHVGAQTLVEDVSLCIRPRRVTALIGPNGAGKSTLLRVATGERSPASGRVVLDGRLLSEWPLRAQARVRAVVAQHSSLRFPFPVLEVVLMGRTPHVQGTESAHDVDVAWAALAQTA